MKNKITKVISAVILSAAIMPGFCSDEKIRVTPPAPQAASGVSEISIEAGDIVSVTILKGGDSVSASGIISNIGETAPVAIERQGSKIVVKISGYRGVKPPASGEMATILKLQVPAGRDITVSGSNLVLSGDIAAKKLDISALSVSLHALKIAADSVSVQAKEARLKFTLTRARRLTVNGSATGRITVPASTEVSAPIGKELKIVRAGK